MTAKFGVLAFFFKILFFEPGENPHALVGNK